MTIHEIILLGLGWAIINIMAGFGAVLMLGDYAWTYMAFIALYFYFSSQLGKKG